MGLPNRKFNVIFNLEFTTSKLLGYLILLTTTVLGYLLSNADIVIVGIVSASALAGAKSISDNWVKIKGGPNKITNVIDKVEDLVADKVGDESEINKTKEIL